MRNKNALQKLDKKLTKEFLKIRHEPNKIKSWIKKNKTNIESVLLGAEMLGTLGLMTANLGIAEAAPEYYKMTFALPQLIATSGFLAHEFLRYPKPLKKALKDVF